MEFHGTQFTSMEFYGIQTSLMEFNEYIKYLALKTMLVQNNIKQICTIGLAAAAA